MPLEHLNDSQLRQVEELVAEASLDPGDFAWTECDGRWAGYIDASVPAYAHKTRGFYCAFADTPRDPGGSQGLIYRAEGTGDHSVLHVPGREGRSHEHLYISWKEALQTVRDWLENVKRELAASGPKSGSRSPEPTGWARVDRGTEAVRNRLGSGKNEEDFQTVGLLCREVIISLAQAVYDPALHTTQDGVTPSDADAKRMLEAFVLRALPGGGNEEARQHARAALSLAIALQHKRTATRRDAMLCTEATTSIVTLVRILAREGDTSASHSEPFRVPRLNEPELDAIVAQYKAAGEVPVLPRMEERDVRLARGFRIAHYPGTKREVWVGFHAGSYEHILMLKPRD